MCRANPARPRQVSPMRLPPLDRLQTPLVVTRRPIPRRPIPRRPINETGHSTAERPPRHVTINRRAISQPQQLAADLESRLSSGVGDLASLGGLTYVEGSSWRFLLRHLGDAERLDSVGIDLPRTRPTHVVLPSNTSARNCGAKAGPDSSPRAPHGHDLIDAGPHGHDLIDVGSAPITWRTAGTGVGRGVQAGSSSSEPWPLARVLRAGGGWARMPGSKTSSSRKARMSLSWAR